MKPKYWAIIILSTLAISAGAVYYARQPAADPGGPIVVHHEIKNPTASSTIEDLKDWKTYTNQNYDVQLAYPKDWFALPLDQTATLWRIAFSNVKDFGPLTDENLKNNAILEITILNNKNPENLSLTDWFNGYFKDSGTEILSQSNVTISGQPAIRIEVVELTKRAHYYLRRGKNIVEITYPTDNQPQFQEIYKLILSTFKFIPPSTDSSTWKTYRNEKYGFEVKYPPSVGSFEDNFSLSYAYNVYLCPLRGGAIDYRLLSEEEFNKGTEIVRGAGDCKAISFQEYAKHFDHSYYPLKVNKLPVSDTSIQAYEVVSNMEYSNNIGELMTTEIHSVLVEVKGIKEVRAIQFDLKNKAISSQQDQIFSTFKFTSPAMIEAGQAQTENSFQYDEIIKEKIGIKGGILQNAEKSVIVSIPPLKQEMEFTLSFKRSNFEVRSGVGSPITISVSPDINLMDSPAPISIKVKSDSKYHLPVAYLIDEKNELHAVDIGELDRENNYFTMYTFHGGNYSWMYVN